MEMLCRDPVSGTSCSKSITLNGSPEPVLSLRRDHNKSASLVFSDDSFIDGVTQKDCSHSWQLAAFRYIFESCCWVYTGPW
jgi:hypothetical protein